MSFNCICRYCGRPTDCHSGICELCECQLDEREKKFSLSDDVLTNKQECGMIVVDK